MTTQLAIDPRPSALLVMDFQTAIVDGYAADKEALLARTASLLEAVRKAEMKVIYVVVAFRPGYPEEGASKGRPAPRLILLSPPRRATWS